MSRKSTQVTLKTRSSLLAAVQDFRNQKAWEEFFQLYQPFIARAAASKGLKGADIDEVVSRVLAELSQRLPEFHYDPQRGSFRSWLFRLVHWRVLDVLKGNHTFVPFESPDAAEEGTRAEDRLPAREPSQREREELAWMETVHELALKKVRRKARDYQIYDMARNRGWDTERIAATLKVTPNHVFVAISRTRKLLEEEVERLRALPENLWKLTPPIPTETRGGDDQAGTLAALTKRGSARSRPR